MPEAIDTIHIDLALEGQAFLDELDKTLEQGANQAKEWSSEIGAAFTEGIRQGMVAELGQTVAEMSTALGISAQDAAESISAMGAAGVATADDLVKMSDAYKVDLLTQFHDTMVEVNAQLQQGQPVTAETAMELANLAAQMDAAKGESQQMASAVDTANAALARMSEQAARARQGPTDAGAWEDATQKVGGFGKILGRVGADVAKFSTGLIAGFTAFKFLTEVKQTIDEAVTAAIKFSEANYRLEVSIRALQRAQGESIGTIREYKAFADGLTETYSVQRAETYNLVAVAARLTGELGATKEQIQGLVEASVIMNQVSGIDATSALYRFTQFINTGYARGLSLMGFQVDRATQQQAALALGITKPIKEWTEQERVLVRTTLIQQQANKYAEDAAAGQDILAKRVERMNQKWNDAVTVLGEFLAPTIIAIKEALNDVAITAVRVATIVAYEVSKMAGQSAVEREAVKAGQEAYNKAIADGMTRQQAMRERNLAHQKAFNEGMAKLNVDLAEEIQRAMGSMGDAAQQGSDTVQKAIAEELAAADAAFADIMRSLDDLAKEYEKAADDIWHNYYQKLEDLDADLARSREDAATNFNRDIADIDRQAAQDRNATIRENQIDELRLREDHQRALRDLESRYLLELEDAVRDRDARQVLMLQRRFNLEKQKENDDYKVKQRRRQQDFQLELRQIEEQRQLKRQRRILEFTEELADIALQDRRKRDDAVLARRRALDDLEADNREKARAIIDDAIRTYNLTKTGLDALNRLLIGEYGSGGYIDKVLQNAIKIVAARMTQMATLLTGPGSAYFNSEKGINQPASKTAGKQVSGHTYMTGGYQRGGSFVATGPQMVPVGEGRPEAVNITPLNAATGVPLAGFGGGAGGGRVRIDLALRLSEGLVAEVIDQAMNETADVVLSMASAEPSGYGGRGGGGRQ